MAVDLRRLPNAGLYRVIYADPAWKFRARSETAAGFLKSPSRHYRCTSFEDMAALPVAHITRDDAWLFMWTTWPFLPQALRLAEAWGTPEQPWIYSTGGAWGKRPRGWRGDPGKWSIGTGYVFRSACEPLLVFRRGHPVWKAKGQRNFWASPVRAHSQKPDEVREDIARATLGPRLEMFANQDHPAFDRWGDGH